MEAAREWIQLGLENGKPERVLGAVLGYDHQTSGRGRHEGRQWLTGALEALTFSLILPPQNDLPLSLALGLGVSFFLEALGIDPKIKWPNDVLVNDEKICGILVLGEALSKPEPGFPKLLYNCGLGLNVFQTDFPQSSFRRQACSLKTLGKTQKASSPRDFLYPLLCALDRSLRLKNEDLLNEIQDRLWNKDKAWTFKNGPADQEQTGLIRGLNKDGALLLETGEGIKKIYSGE